MDKLINFLYRLFFDREDSLDTLQILFTAIVIITLMVVWNLSNGTMETPEVKVESLITLRWLVGLLVITAVPKWMIPAMTKVLTRGNLPSTSKKQESYDISNEIPS